jgi:hypothetical protein
MCPASSAEMFDDLTLEAKEPQLSLRCECGAMVTANGEESLVERVRLHFGEFHPNLGSNVPADLILAMAEEKEKK